MATRKTSNLDSVRDAFEDLGTSEKAAFVLEATFETIAQALAETGRRAASTLDDLDIDSWFSPRTEPVDVGAPPAPPPTAAPPKPTRKTTPKPKGKTAGKPATPKRRPPSDDA